ncbi:MAG: hypothetical protein LBJ93_01320 [Clostridiales bacterium]|jgi:N-glycosylase/DNA lyase|nr:hypothetical protein [Clostridiales bacterium]
MKYKKDKSKIILECEDFDVYQTLNCGQCFRFFNLNKNKFIIIAKEKILEIEQVDKNKIFFNNCDTCDFENIWIDYFDLNRNYCEIKKILCIDSFLKQVIDFSPGIRILKQDFFETLISFIISQNNRIARIKKIIENISRVYGKKIKENFFSFPKFSDLVNLSEDEFRILKTGFRAKYIIDAIKKNYKFKNLKFLETQDIKKKLIEINGVGNKIANCVLLFSFSRYENFPVDVWIKRIIEKKYFDGNKKSVLEIEKFGIEKFGNLAGFAQQYLYNFAINNDI